MDLGIIQLACFVPWSQHLALCVHYWRTAAWHALSPYDFGRRPHRRPPRHSAIASGNFNATIRRCRLFQPICRLSPRSHALCKVSKRARTRRAASQMCTLVARRGVFILRTSPSFTFRRHSGPEDLSFLRLIRWLRPLQYPLPVAVPASLCVLSLHL